MQRYIVRKYIAIQRHSINDNQQKLLSCLAIGQTEINLSKFYSIIRCFQRIVKLLQR